MRIVENIKSAKPWSWGTLQPHAYHLIVVDPPLHYVTYSPKGQGKSPSRHYRTMKLEAIKALPIAELAADNCMLVLWATQAGLAGAVDTLRAWDFKFCTAGAWAKLSKTGRKWAFGTGHVLHSAAEFYLLGTRGHPRIAVRNVRNLVVAPVREHSRKPDQLQAELERLFPDARKAELYARQQRAGWDCWGDQVEMFEGDELTT